MLLARMLARLAYTATVGSGSMLCSANAMLTRDRLGMHAVGNAEGYD